MNINYFNTLEEAIEDAKFFASNSPQIESCGIIGYKEDNETFVFCSFDNISEKPRERFLIPFWEQVIFHEKFMSIAVFHSHITFDCQASKGDKECSAVATLPYLIYSTASKETSLYIPPTVKGSKFLWSGALEKLKEIFK